MVRRDVKAINRRGRLRIVAAALALSLTVSAFTGTAATAEAPKLGLPIDCQFGVNCYIQQYVDTEPGDRARDFRGGLLSYQNHSGTDFALLTRHQMRVGVPVIAAADGRVIGIRNNMQDGQFLREGPKSLKGKDCGNGVQLDHGDGWSTQYCHLRQGSVKLRVGQLVRSGDALGLVGMSGRAAFPHIHLSVFQGKLKIDPFTGRAINGACNRNDCNRPLWRPATARTLTYRPGGLIDSGFSDATITYDKIKDGTAKQNRIGAAANAIMLYAYGYGSRTGDVITIAITPPGASRPSTHQTTLKRNQAQFGRWFGIRRPKDGWQKGIYQGTVTMRRAGRVLQIKKSKMLIR